MKPADSSKIRAAHPREIEAPSIVWTLIIDPGCGDRDKNLGQRLFCMAANEPNLVTANTHDGLVSGLTCSPAVMADPAKHAQASFQAANRGERLADSQDGGIGITNLKPDSSTRLRSDGDGTVPWNCFIHVGDSAPDPVAGTSAYRVARPTVA